MKKFFGEFKKFITRGNVMDLAVGVIIGGAFTAIVTALTSNILQPLINALISVIFGDGSLAVYTVLVGSAEDLANSIYIDWGAFISAIINFLLIAIVLFIIVKIVNKIGEDNDKFKSELKKNILTKEEKNEMKALGLNYRDIKEVKKFKADKAAAAEAEAQKAALEQQAAEEESKKHTTEYLLEEIKVLLQKSVDNK